MTFNDALQFGRAVWQSAGKHPIQRETLFATAGWSANQATKNLITTSNKYGITKGHHAAKEFRLTEKGVLILDPAVAAAQRTRAAFELAIDSVREFRGLYERFKGEKLPAPEVMRDTLANLHEGDRKQCVDIFTANAQTVGLLAPREGAEYLRPVEQASIETSPGKPAADPNIQKEAMDVPANQPLDEDFAKVCFFIAPIGDEGTEERKHSDMLLSSFLERAVGDLGIKVVRADKIEKPGMITGQVINYILNSRLVVADLSYLNPNVFYELSLRHATGKPTIHIMRTGERIPFDLKDYRTVSIDMTCKYSLVAKLDIYRADISNKIRQALAEDVTADNPILTFCPKGRFTIQQ
jgi:hypothetical protein